MRELHHAASVGVGVYVLHWVIKLIAIAWGYTVLAH